MLNDQLLGLTEKSSALILAAILTTALMRKSSPSARHIVLLATVLGLIAIPFVNLLSVHWTVPIARPQVAVYTPAPSPITNHPAVTDPMPETGPVPEVSTSRFIDPVPTRSKFNLGTVIAVVYLIGFGGLVGRLVLGSGVAWWRVRNAKTIAFHRLVELTSRVGLRRVPQLRSLNGLGTPGTIGLVHPVIVVPSESESWADEQFEMALVHELAHIRRRDWLWGLVAEVSKAVYWPNPLVWILSARMRAESERACDEEVLLSGFSPSRYARVLLAIARGSTRRGQLQFASYMAHRTSMEGRIRRIALYREAGRPHSRIATNSLCIATFALTIAVACAQQAGSPALPQSEDRNVAGNSSTKIDSVPIEGWRTGSDSTLSLTKVAADGTVVRLSISRLKTRPTPKWRAWNAPLSNEGEGRPRLVSPGGRQEPVVGDRVVIPTIKSDKGPIITVILINPRLANVEGDVYVRILGTQFGRKATMDRTGKATVSAPLWEPIQQDEKAEVGFLLGSFHQVHRIDLSGLAKNQPISLMIDRTTNQWLLHYGDKSGSLKGEFLRDERGRLMGGHYPMHPLLEILGVFKNGSTRRLPLYDGAVIPVAKTDEHFKDLHMTVSSLKAVIVEATPFESVKFLELTQLKETEVWSWQINEGSEQK